MSIPHAGRTSVVSVDGPARLTITAPKGKGKATRRLPIRLAAIDTPEPGQCGATQSQAALQQIVTKTKRTKLRYALVPDGKGGYDHDATGRLFARVTYPVKYGVIDFAGRLFTSGWAFAGASVGLGDPEPRSSNADISDDDSADDDSTLAGHTPVGLWAACRGYAHGAATATGPPAPAPIWSITPQGITTAIGPLALPVVAAPGSTLTFEALASQVPLELRRLGPFCFGEVPSLQLEVLSMVSSAATSCGPQDVGALISDGPGIATSDRGLKVLGNVSTVRPLFPLVLDDSDVERLSGVGRAWAWQTIAPIDAKGRIESFATYATTLDDN